VLLSSNVVLVEKLALPAAPFRLPPMGPRAVISKTTRTNMQMGRRFIVFTRFD